MTGAFSGSEKLKQPGSWLVYGRTGNIYYSNEHNPKDIGTNRDTDAFLSDKAVDPAGACAGPDHGTINGSNVHRGRQLEERGKHLDAFVVSILKVFVVRKYLRLKNN